MAAPALEAYLAAFTALCRASGDARRPEVAAPGIRGLAPAGDDPRVRLLVVDDRAYDALAALAPHARAGMIRVFETAERCCDLIRRELGWSSDSVTPMSCPDLEAVPPAQLPADLTLRPVRRRDDDPPDGVPLDDAVALAIQAQPPGARPPRDLREYLRSLPPAFRLFAATDRTGAIRATSGCGTFCEHASVIFVNTHRPWRGRGIGRAMTAAALHAAREAGARAAGLDASDAGVPIYRRLGFTPLARTTRFSHGL